MYLRMCICYQHENQSDTLSNKRAKKKCRILTVFFARFNVKRNVVRILFLRISECTRKGSRNSSSHVLRHVYGKMYTFRMLWKDMSLFERSFSANCTGSSRSLRNYSEIDSATSSRWPQNSEWTSVTFCQYRWPCARLVRAPGITHWARQVDSEGPSPRPAS